MSGATIQHTLKTLTIIDLFCGAGGTSFGFTSATLNGEQIANVVACVNHDPLAIKSHLANFPNCIHFIEDVRSLDVSKLPRKQPGDDSIWILWASLECTHFSNAKTGSRDADSRTLAHALYPYIHHINPDLIKIENVREFMSWGPLVPKIVKKKGSEGEYCPIVFNKKTKSYGPHNVPEARTKGRDYLEWRNNIEAFGYRYESRILNSADFGAHQKRLRYFGVFAKPDMPIVFPSPTHDKHGRNGLPRWNAVRDVLELHEIGESIFSRKKPLSPKTLERVLSGLIKFVKPEVDAYLVSNYSGNPRSRALSIDDPCPTLTTIPHESLVHVKRKHKPGFLIQYNGQPDGSVTSLETPSRTVTTKDRFQLVSFMDNQFGTGRPSSIDSPCNTLTTVPKQRIVTASTFPFILNPQFSSAGGSVESPCFTLIAKMDKRPPYLVTAASSNMSGDTGVHTGFYHNTEICPSERISVFMQEHGISDVFMRMLKVGELKRIQGFPTEYVLHGPQDAQKKFIGNAVVPQVVCAWAIAYFEAINGICAQSAGFANPSFDRFEQLTLF